MRLLPNPKKACISPILEIFSQPEDFIGIYQFIPKFKSHIKKRQKGNKITGSMKKNFSLMAGLYFMVHALIIFLEIW